MDNYKPKGLKNFGLRCYMNSLLQCFYYIPELRTYFITNKDTFNDKQPVCQALAESINGIKNEKKDYYEPNSLKEAIKNLNKLFEDNKACDVKDLFINIIDALLSEFNINNSVNDINDENEINEDNLGKTVQFESVEKLLDKNIINELFSGYYITSTTCKEKTKNKVYYSFQNESFISFDLRRVYKNCKNDLTIDSCFKEYYKPKKSEYYCPQCKKAHLMESQEKLYKPPKILAILLDRGRGKTFTEKFIFNSEILDLTKYIDQRNIKDEDCLYYLVAVSTHSGSSSASGHYTACCLADDKEYYYFSDIFVKKIKLSEIYDNEPYLLFYRRTEKSTDNNNDNNLNEKIRYNESNILSKNIDDISPKDNITQFFDFLLKNNTNNCNKYTIDYYDKNNKDSQILKLIINGPKNTAYENGKFVFKLDFNQNYEEYLTDITTLETPIYHLNFEKQALLFKYKYDKSNNLLQNLHEYFNFLYNLFLKPDKSLVVKFIIARFNEKKDEEKYKTKALEFTNKYATQKATLYI